jgi:hypothetical protein
MGVEVDRVEKYGCKIITVEPSQRRVEAVIKSGTVVQVAVYTVEPFFRWPVVGENWMIRRENGTWILDSLWQEQGNGESGNQTTVNGVEEGDALIDTPTGNIYLTTGATVVTSGALGAIRERGRAKLSSGKVTVTAPGVEAENVVLLTGEGTVANGVVIVKERKAGVSFLVEATVTSGNSDFVNWAILW